ncbi:MAG: HEAT repeat domain-containing protein [Candidatus Helarchaeota archaeon]
MPLFGPPNIEKLKAKRNVKGLIKALDYEKDWKVRRDAVLALKHIGDVNAIGPLINALKDKKVYYEVVQALAKIGTPAVEPLIAAHSNGSSYVQRGAVDALARISDPRTLELRHLPQPRL